MVLVFEPACFRYTRSAIKRSNLQMGIKPLAYNLIYHADVKRVDLPRIDEKNKSMIKRAIQERFATNPEVYGRPLLRTLKGYWKLRVGDYRVVFKISGNHLHIFGIIHRKRVYQDIERRIK